ncbi:hypothetical protein J6590_049257 [Homalodisca vitripennis]|nr:hypothetical protein J6590_049257 [Homalodisca vitripennis]
MELTNSPICIPVHRESSNQSTIFLTNARLTLVAVGLYSIFTIVPAGEARGASRHFHPKYKVPESTRVSQSVQLLLETARFVTPQKFVTELDDSFINSSYFGSVSPSSYCRNQHAL